MPNTIIGNGATIRKVWLNSFSGQLLLTVPNGCGIQDGDIVEIRRVEPDLKTTACPKCNKKYADHTVRELYDHNLLYINSKVK